MLQTHLQHFKANVCVYDQINMYTCILSYVYMQDNYVYMQDNCVYMQDIYVYMQDNYVYMQDNYVYM